MDTTSTGTTGTKPKQKSTTKPKTTAKIEHGPVWINDREFGIGTYVDEFQLKGKGPWRTVKIKAKDEKRPRFFSVQVPKGLALENFHISSTDMDDVNVVAIASYVEVEEKETATLAATSTEEPTCIRCGRTIVCGVNPTCGDKEPSDP